MKCPRCSSVRIKQFRHPKSSITCINCGFILRDEGNSEMNRMSLGDQIESIFKSLEDRFSSLSEDDLQEIE